MTPESQPLAPITDQDIVNLRHSLSLLQSQVEASRVDPDLLVRQLAKMRSFVEQADSEHRLLKRERRFEVLYNVTQVISASLDLQVVVDHVMDAVIQVTGAERGFLMMRDDDGGVRVVAARNLDQQTLTSDKFAYSHTIVNRTLDGGEPIVTTNAAEDPRFAGQLSIIGQALRSIMASPLRVRGRVIGVAYVDSRAMVGLFDKDDLAALETLTTQAAIAIENARLFSETDQALARRVDELTQLRRIDNQLNQSLDPERTMLTVLEWACRLAEAEVGHLAQSTADAQGLNALCHYGAAIDETQPRQLADIYPEARQALQSKTKHLHHDKKRNFSVAVFPILREQQLFGLLILRRSGEFAADALDLVERVLDRAVVALENARLYERVQAADRAKSEFVGIVAHDLKVPMTSMLGYADLALMEGGLSERQISFMGKIKDTVRRMERLVSDLSDISRIESGHFFMTPSYVAVEAVLQEVRDATLNQIRERSHAYVETIAPGLPQMHVDYYRLIQVLTNLLSNAYKYTPEGGTITLSARQNNHRIEFSVSDTGIGLTEEQMAMLGTKFWRAEDEFTRAQPGTGLGFSITRSLVELMGSTIQIESTVGMGSSFTFSVAIAN